MDRREFFTKGVKKYLEDLAKNLESNCPEDSTVPKTEKKDDGDMYFESVLNCYPLLSEAPYDLLVDAAKSLGINTENKTKLELVKKVFGKGGTGRDVTS